MPIPPLNAVGLLPEGVHECTLDELGARFGRFQKSDRRVYLFEKLRQFVAEQQMAGLALELLIDGSFVTDKAEPGDIDLVVVLPQGYNPRVELPPFRYNAISKAVLRQRYRFDVFVVEAGSPEYAVRSRYFQQRREDESKRKGILRIKL